MTKREFWLKLFSENDTALASAIILCERFVTDEQLKNGKDYIKTYKKDLYEEMPKSKILKVFPNYKPTNPFDKIVGFCKQNFDVLGCSDSHINMLVGDEEYVIAFKKLKDGEHWSEKV